MSRPAGLDLEVLGTITGPLGRTNLCASHLSVPTPVLLADEGIIRLFASSRDFRGVSRVFHIDVDAEDPLSVVGAPAEPVLDVGVRGAFDQHGIICTSIRWAQGATLEMLYAGFDVVANHRYRLLTGIASSSDLGRTFTRTYSRPLLPSTSEDQYVRGAAVFGEMLDPAFQGQVVYGGGSDWVTTSDGRDRPRYDLKSVSFDPDAGALSAHPRVILRPADGEHGFGRPASVVVNGRRFVFLSVRSAKLSTYTSEVAEIDPSGAWKRNCLPLSVSGTTDTTPPTEFMFAAPVVTEGGTWVFLNGSKFGESGITVARLREI